MLNFQSLTLVWREELLWRNITFQFVKTAVKTRPEYLHWMISSISAAYEVSEGEADSYYKLLMTTEEMNPVSVAAPLNTSYSCQEPRSASLLTFLLSQNSSQSRQLHSAIITMKWVHLLRPGTRLNPVTVCPQHGRDFVPKAVGFTLVGVILTILIIYFVGRNTVEKKANYDSIWLSLYNSFFYNLTWPFLFEKSFCKFKIWIKISPDPL